MQVRALISVFISAVFLTQTSAVAAPQKKFDAKTAAAIQFLEKVKKSELGTYRQVLQQMKPFTPQEIIEELTRRQKDHLDDAFPKTSYVQKKDVIAVGMGKGQKRVQMQIPMKDAEVFMRTDGFQLTWAEVNDGFLALKKMDELAKKKGARPGALLWTVMVPEAQAQWWPIAVGTGMVALAVGIYFGLKALSNANVNVNHTGIPTQFDVNTNSSFNIPAIPSLPEVPASWRVFDGQR